MFYLLETHDLIVIGGGAAGFMSAITASENGVKKIRIYEASTKLLEKVRISGGGRCNVTNATWIPNELIENYPRGKVELFGPFSRFASGDVFEWFESRGVKLKIENDQRIFPISDSSSDIINCLTYYAKKGGVSIKKENYIKKISKCSNNIFRVFETDENYVQTKALLISTGGNPSGYKLAKMLGHQIIKPVPSLFTFTCKDDKLRSCKGVSLQNIELKLLVNKSFFTSIGDLLITHWGFSGPAVLKLSSIAARELFLTKYKCQLIIKWSSLNREELLNKLNQLREFNGKSYLYNLRPLPILTKRLWLYLLNRMKISKDKRWAELLSSEKERMISLLLYDSYEISGKGPFGEEFVTSGGVDIKEINFKTMESRLSSGLFFAGEVLDIDGITGGFNFQHCWTSGWLAGMKIAQLNKTKVTNQ